MQKWFNALEYTCCNQGYSVNTLNDNPLLDGKANKNQNSIHQQKYP
ncbi:MULTISPECIES: hypothetical protein [Pseudoalteromonas]|nr:MULTISPECIES: hypothetical protein [Pseudoalteromonas]